jgi:hypothetical protein
MAKVCKHKLIYRQYHRVCPIKPEFPYDEHGNKIWPKMEKVDRSYWELSEDERKEIDANADECLECKEPN